MNLQLQQKTTIKADLQSRYTIDNNPSMISLMNKATLLDPRFKSKFCEDDTEKEDLLKELNSEMLSIAEISTPHEIELDEEPPKKKSRAAGIGSLLKKNKTATAPLSREELAPKELSVYLSEPEGDYEDSPITWWKRESCHLPMLSQVARKYLCVNATSVASEHIFSLRGNIVTKNDHA